MFDVIGSLQKIRKIFSSKEILLVILLLTLFFSTRLYRLEAFPIFSDEGIYIRWAKVAWHDAQWRFISLTDGRQPLQTWGTIAFLKLFPNSALFAGRLFAVASGLFGLVGIFIASLYLFGKRAALWSAFLYIITPYFLFYDRLALVDSAVNAFFIWIFLLSIVFARSLRLDVSLFFGLLSGMALLAKSSVRLFIGLSFLSVIFIIWGHIKSSLLKKVQMRDHLLRGKLISYIFLYGVVVLIAVVIYNVQRLSPFFHFVAEKNKTFVLTFSEVLQNPFGVLFHNLKVIPYYVFSEMAYVVPALGAVGLYHLSRRDRVMGLYIALWLLLSYVAVSVVAKVLFPRYIIHFGSLLVLCGSYLLSQIKDNRKRVWLGGLVVVSVSYFNYTMFFDYPKIPFPSIDRGQYLEAWTAGWGARDIVEYARERSKEKPVILLAEGNFGMSHDVLDVFVKADDKITIKGYWPLNSEHLIENQEHLQDYVVYVVFSHRDEFPEDWPIEFVKKYDKPGGTSAIYLFRLTK